MVDNRYYVFATSWEGADDEKVLRWMAQGDYDSVFDTKEEAEKEVCRLYAEELAPDECTYIVHNNKLIWRT